MQTFLVSRRPSVEQRDYLEQLSQAERDKLERSSAKSLRHAWPNRHTLRGRIQASANVAMLRNLRSI